MLGARHVQRPLPLWGAALALLVSFLSIAAGALLVGGDARDLNILQSMVMMCSALVLAYLSAAEGRLASPAFLFVVIYGLLVYSGTVMIYLEDGTSDPSAISGALLATAAGAFLVGSRWRGRRGLLSAVGHSVLPRHTMALVLGIGTATVLISAFLAFHSGVPLFQPDIDQGFVAVASQSPPYTLEIVYDLSTILAALLVVQACELRTRGAVMGAGAAILAAVALFALASRRYPSLFLALVIFIILARYRWRPAQLRRGAVLSVIGLVVLLAGFVYLSYVRDPHIQALASQDGAGSAIWYAFYRRVLYIQAHIVEVILTVFPHPYPFFGGAELADQFLRVPWTQPKLDIPNFLFTLLGLAGPVWDPSITAGWAPPTLLGELYMNYGLWLSFCCMAAVGIVLGWYERAFAWRARSGAGLVAYSVLGMYLAISCIEGALGTVHSIAYSLVLIGVFLRLIPWAAQAGLRW